MKKYPLHLLYLSILALTSTAKNVIDSSYKLPKNVKPIRYTLIMEPNMDIKDGISTFNGSVVIELLAMEITKNITLNARDLFINEDSIEIVSSIGSQIKVSEISIDDDREFYTIHLEDKLAPNEYYNLTVAEFRGDLKYDNVGFYIAKYEDSEGQERNLAVTDFEPTDARKAFPCFDEPAVKATYIIKLVRPENYNSVSNEELISTENLGFGRYLDTFKETVIMPSYVVAFMVSEYKHTPRQERHRIFANPMAIDSGKLDYALTIAVETLQVLEEFTGINYTHTKMDQIAIPDAYFKDEAMENWGLVTFSEKHLFISNETSTTEDIQKCTTYIAHEFSHQWFGNLVTFKDWKYLWLSEGFGAFFQYYIASIVKPSWRLMDQFVLFTHHRILENDMSNDGEPMNYQPKYLGTIPSPWICYYKASSIIRMTQHFLTNDIFTKGLQTYLIKNKFGATEPLDLYRAFQQVIDKENAHALLGNNSVSSILGTWDSNPGYPLVTVSRNYTTGTITLSQTRHFEDEKPESDDSIWYIPVSYAFQSKLGRNFSDTTAGIWFTEKNMVVNNNFPTEGWLLINKQQTGFYRTNYDLTNWNRLAAFLNSENYDSIHVVNRAQLLFDAFHFAQNGKVPYEVPLNISKYLIREKDYIAINPFLNAMKYINLMMGSSEIYDVFKNYIIHLLSTSYDYLGFDEKPNDTNLDKLNRVEILKWLCRFGHSECRNNALQKLREWKETGTFSVSQNLQPVVLCGAMRNALTDDWDFVYRKMVNASVYEQHKYLKALSCSEDKKILNKFLDELSNTTVLLPYKGRMYIGAIANAGTVGLNTVFEYVKNRTGIPKHVQYTFAYELGSRFTSEEQLNQMKLLNATHGGLFGYGIKFVEENLIWSRKGYTKQIEDWLRQYTFENIESTNIV